MGSPNGLVPNDGAPVCVGFRPNGELASADVDEEFMNDGAPLFPPNGAPVICGDIENMDARNGFAAPAAPVACGRRPTPREDIPIPPISPAPVG